MATLRNSKALPDVPNRSSSTNASEAAPAGTGTSAGADLHKPEDEANLWINLSKQAKFILLGGLPVWYLDVPGSILYVLEYGGEDWTRTLALVALVFLLSTCAFFAYVILLPAQGVTPNYANWNRDPHLRGLIPALTVSIVGGYITLLLLLSPLCNPKPSLSSILPNALAKQLSSAAESAGSNMQAISRNVQTMASRASSSLFTSLYRPAVPVRDAKSWLPGGGSGAIDTKRLLQALKITDTASLGKQLNVPAKRLNDFSKALEKSLRSIDMQSLQASLAQMQSAAAIASSERHSPNWWAKKGVWGWCRALIGSGSTYLLVFGTMGLLGLFGTSQGAARRRAEARSKQSL